MSSHAPLALAIRTFGFAALVATLPTPAVAQDISLPRLSVAKVIYEPPASGSSSATVRVTVANAAGGAATSTDQPVVVKIILVNPNGRNTTYEAPIRASIPGGATQSGVISVPAIYMKDAGTHTVTAWAAVPVSGGKTPVRSPDRIEKIMIGNPGR